jgi:hypothetical protein
VVAAEAVHDRAQIGWLLVEAPEGGRRPYQLPPQPGGKPLQIIQHSPTQLPELLTGLSTAGVPTAPFGSAIEGGRANQRRGETREELRHQPLCAHDPPLPPIRPSPGKAEAEASCRDSVRGGPGGRGQGSQTWAHPAQGHPVAVKVVLEDLVDAGGVQKSIESRPSVELDPKEPAQAGEVDQKVRGGCQQFRFSGAGSALEALASRTVAKVRARSRVPHGWLASGQLTSE